MMTQELKIFSDRQTRLAEIAEQVQAIEPRASAAKSVATEFENAKQDVATAKEKRRSILAQIHMGQKADIGKADKILAEAERTCEALADTGTGAAAAAEILEAQLRELKTEANAIEQELPALQYRAALAETQDLIAAYAKAGDAVEAAYADIAGALMVLEQLRNSSDPPYAWHHNFSSEISLPWTPLLEQAGFLGFRAHPRVLAKAQEQRQPFADRLHALGIV
jgi:chromosome segregation ATPase